MRQQILIIEDDPASRLFIRHTLERDGFSILEAGDGETALMLLEANQPAIVFLDLLLPRVLGVDVLNYIHTAPHLHTTHTLILSAHDLGRTVNLRPGDGFLLKPVTPAQIRDAVNTALQSATSL